MLVLIEKKKVFLLFNLREKKFMSRILTLRILLFIDLLPPSILLSRQSFIVVIELSEHKLIFFIRLRTLLIRKNGMCLFSFHCPEWSRRRRRNPLEFNRYQRIEKISLLVPISRVFPLNKSLWLSTNDYLFFSSLMSDLISVIVFIFNYMQLRMILNFFFYLFISNILWQSAIASTLMRNLTWNIDHIDLNRKKDIKIK